MGGLSGHMMHIHDSDVHKDHIKDIFKGIIFDEIRLTEKVDGFNIHFFWDKDTDELVFARSQEDLKIGGIHYYEIDERFAHNPTAIKIFKEAYEIISNSDTKPLRKLIRCDKSNNNIKTVNAECVTEGITNVLYYDHPMVVLHNIWNWGIVNNGNYTSTYIEDIPDYTDSHGLTTLKPLRLNHIDHRENMYHRYANWVDEIFGDSENLTDYYYKRFVQYLERNNCTEFPEVSIQLLYSRLIKGNTVPLRKIRTSIKKELGLNESWVYRDDVDRLLGSDVRRWCKKEMEELILRFGCDVLRNIRNQLNGDNNYESKQNKIDFEKLDEYNRWRMRICGYELFNLEGIVFQYNGHTFKLTGSFAPYNQIIGKQRK